MPSARKRGLSFNSYVSTGASYLCRGCTLPHDHNRSSPPPLLPFICTVCNFHALDQSGLLQHLHDSTHCYTIVNADQSPFNGDDDCSDNNCLPSNVEDSTVDIEEEHYESDGTHVSVANPNEEPGSSAFSSVLLVNWSSSSEDDNDIGGNEDDDE
jgi:hypothetical protein